MFDALVFALVLSILVFIHELGHFLAAKWAKVNVDEFGIGYPPRLLKLFKWRETSFTLNLIPLGGFVKLAGENGPAPEATEEKTTTKSKQPLKHQFYQASLIQKLVIILAGATFNLVFGFLLFALVFTKMGIPTPITEARIGEIAPDSPAQAAQIPVGVTITAFEIDGETIPTATSQDVIDTVGQHRGKTVTVITTGPCRALECEPGEHRYEAYLRTESELPENQGSLGVAFDPVAYVFYAPSKMIYMSMWYGLEQTFFLSQQILFALRQLVVDVFQAGKVPSDLAGPIGIVDQASSAGIFKQGTLSILTFMGMLSINLAIINVLPISPLDGGRAVFIVLEKIFAKKVSQKIEYYATYVGYIFLLLLIVLVTIRDVLRVLG